MLLSLAFLYGVAPRGYVRGTLAYAPGGGEPQIISTQWRLAPPRWLADVPYPFWTVRESGGQYLQQPSPDETAGSVRTYQATSERFRWAGPAYSRNSVSSKIAIALMTPEAAAVNTPSYARRVMDGIVRRQCRGFPGVWADPDDGAFPDDGSRDPWRWAPEEFSWIPP